MNSIRSRLAVTLFIGFIVFLSGASFLIFFISKGMLESDFDSRLFAKAQAVLASISQNGEQLDVDWTELPQEVNPRRHAHDLIQIFDGTGHTVFKDSPLTDAPRALPAEATYRNIELSDVHFRLLAISFVPHVEENKAPAPPALLRKPCLLLVATDRRSLDHSLRKFAVILVAMTITTSLLSLGLVWFVLRRGLRPLNALADAVVNIAPESLGQTLPLDDLPNELAPIVVKLNDLLSRLDASFARERRFNADISHELRTPVAELKTLSEVMLQESAHAPEFRKAFEHTYNIATQMEALVTVLLEMVRNEERRSALALTDVDLTSVIKAARGKYESMAEKKGVILGLLPQTDDFSIRSEPRLLSIIFANLFDNAIEYSPVGSQVDIKIQRDKKAPYVTITNTAENLSPSDLPHIFERFWRKDKARGESNHFGIGLALTRTLCQRLGIHLTVSLEKASLVSFRLYLPTKGTNHEN